MLCVFCGEEAPTMGHFDQAQAERTFARKDLLKQHIQQMHFTTWATYQSRREPLRGGWPPSFSPAPQSPRGNSIDVEDGDNEPPLPEAPPASGTETNPIQLELDASEDDTDDSDSTLSTLYWKEPAPRKNSLPKDPRKSANRLFGQTKHSAPTSSLIKPMKKRPVSNPQFSGLIVQPKTSKLDTVFKRRWTPPRDKACDYHCRRKLTCDGNFPAKEHVLSGLAEDIIESIPEVRTAKDVFIGLLPEILPSLLQAFARALGRLNESAFSGEAMVFLNGHVDVIVSKLKSKLQLSITPKKKVVGRWVEKEVPAVKKSEKTRIESSISKKDIFGEQALGKKDERTSFSFHEHFIAKSPAYLWFKSRIRRESLVSRPVPNAMQFVWDAIVGRASDLNDFSAVFTVNWDPVQFIQDQELPGLLDGGLGRVITLTGEVSDGQILTVEEYIQQTWPLTGMGVLEAVEDAIRKVHGSQSEVERLVWPAGYKPFAINARGTIDAVAEIGQQLSWMGAALRSLQNNTGLAYCSPLRPTVFIRRTDGAVDFSSTTAKCYIDFLTEDTQEPTTPLSGQCWQALFRGAVIAKGFPVRKRREKGIGMEIPLNILAGLSRASRVHEFSGHIFLKAFSALLVLTKITTDVIVWHLLYNQNGEHLPYTNYRVKAVMDGAPQSVYFQSVQSARHVVGWCPKVSCLAGLPGTSDHVDRCELPHTQQGCVLEKVVISGGQFITAGASFVLGKKDNPVYLRPRDDYFEQLIWMSKKFVIFHDTEDRRAWMVDGASALLHLVRASLKHNQDDDFRHLFMFDPTQLTEAPSESSARKAAIDVLANYKNLDVKLRLKAVETSEEETTRADGAVELVTKRKKTYYTFKDRVDYVCHFLEQMMAYQSQALSQDGVGFKIKGTARRQLEGFDFRDIAEGRDPILPRVATLQSPGVGWVDLAQTLRAITLFGRGFGDIFKPTSDVQICSHWSAVPKALDYLTIGVSDLQEIIKTKGCTHTNDDSGDGQQTQTASSHRHWKLAGDIYWLKSSMLFGTCKSSSNPNAHRCCERVQVLLPTSIPRLWAKLSSPLVQELHDAADGAVIFGHNRKLTLWRPGLGDPEDEYVESVGADTSNDSLSVPLTDSGIGSSVDLTQSSSQLSPLSHSAEETPDAQGRKRRNPFSRSWKKRQKHSE
ncbi:hypothetical protein K458DRAFT_492684 [Lentithecium fluviatile CBS 122367]|uniref:Uncharacterized protein n=1 Tax=Lentithecium fluviatile CBS 122367 TaxID=1168545 RepID=A0A6G1IDJ9_9PLEO|nr:hypothetical protein K458DRAFT_492684 [Lentithecium fluviatile CBS 122367]